uniref:Peptidase S54 rhomboid domain-containing protein n=1 Tax=Palpitomonas bilix TaxID=652834 RepID=A0A7S3CVP7_9EUKA
MLRFSLLHRAVQRLRPSGLSLPCIKQQQQGVIFKPLLQQVWRSNYRKSAVIGSGFALAAVPILSFAEDGDRRDPALDYIRMKIGEVKESKALLSILAMNAGVFALWRHRGARDMFMSLNFTCSKLHLLNGRVWCSLTSSFSHNTWPHFLLNSVGFVMFGTALTPHALSESDFLSLYLVSCVASSFCSALFQIGRASFAVSLGASGGIMGLIFADMVLNPSQKVFMFPIPVVLSIEQMVGIAGAISLMGALLNRGRIDHAGHLGGMIGGLLYLAGSSSSFRGTMDYGIGKFGSMQWSSTLAESNVTYLYQRWEEKLRSAVTSFTWEDSAVSCIDSYLDLLRFLEKELDVNLDEQKQRAKELSKKLQLRR